MTRTATSICHSTTCRISLIRGFWSATGASTYILGTGWDDQCLGQNQELDRIMSGKGIPHKLYTWETWNSHDWPTWQRMMQEYLIKQGQGPTEE